MYLRYLTIRLHYWLSVSNGFYSRRSEIHTGGAGDLGVGVGGVGGVEGEWRRIRTICVKRPRAKRPLHVSLPPALTGEARWSGGNTGANHHLRVID